MDTFTTSAGRASQHDRTTSADKPERTVISHAARCMGTTVSVQIAATPDHERDAHISAATTLTWLAEVDARLSRFQPESDLCDLNRHAGHWYTASPMLYTAVERAVRAADESCGLFDPTLLPQIEALGYDRDFAEIAHHEVDTIRRRVSEPSRGAWRDIVLDRRRQRVLLPPNVRLDLGGIAKGWAADVALDTFCAGYPGALVNVGGDLRAHGGPSTGVGWSIGVSDPRSLSSASATEDVDGKVARDDHPLVTITLSRGGLATSGAVRRWWLREGNVTHHLIDPRTGAPAPLWTAGEEHTATEDDERIASVTALAPTAAQAEAATKIALLTGYPGALTPTLYGGIARAGALGQLVPAHAVALLVVLGNGQWFLSGDFDDYLRSWATEGASVPYTVRSAADALSNQAAS